MKKTHRKSAFNQGYIKEIYDLFFRPLICYKPNDMLLNDWLAELFHIKERDITRYHARADFKLPGLYLDAPLRAIQGLGLREVKKGHELIVRKDSRDTTYDVEFSELGKEQVFKLSESQWNSIAAKLSPVEKNDS